MSGQTRVIKRYESFVLGKCRCGCGTDISIRSGHYLKKWAPKHWYKKGEDNHTWRGGIIIDQKGYIKVMDWDHPQHDNKGYVFLHRLVYEYYYNVCLLPWIDIDHINEDKLDNRIENLQPLTKAQHNSKHKTIDKSGRRCVNPDCIDRDYIYHNKLGIEHWFVYGDGFQCRRCYMREYDRERKEKRKFKL